MLPTRPGCQPVPGSRKAWPEGTVLTTDNNNVQRLSNRNCSFVHQCGQICFSQGPLPLGSDGRLVGGLRSGLTRAIPALRGGSFAVRRRTPTEQLSNVKYHRYTCPQNSVPSAFFKADFIRGRVRCRRVAYSISSRSAGCGRAWRLFFAIDRLECCQPEKPDGKSLRIAPSARPLTITGTGIELAIVSGNLWFLADLCRSLAWRPGPDSLQSFQG